MQEVARARHRGQCEGAVQLPRRDGRRASSACPCQNIRKFLVRVQGCNVISGSDTDFGRVLVPESVCDSVLPSITVDKSKLTHLPGDKQQQFLQLIDRYACCFSDKPGLCSVADHRIDVTADFVPKKMRTASASANCILEILKPQVERQIKELLDAGMIMRSSNPMASSLVYVIKKQGGVCFACDYRYMNSFTVADVFLLFSVDEVVRKVRQGKYISVLDAKYMNITN